MILGNAVYNLNVVTSAVVASPRRSSRGPDHGLQKHVLSSVALRLNTATCFHLVTRLARLARSTLILEDSSGTLLFDCFCLESENRAPLSSNLLRAPPAERPGEPFDRGVENIFAFLSR